MNRLSRPGAVVAFEDGRSRVPWLVLLALTAALAVAATQVHAQVTPPGRNTPSSPGGVPLSPNRNSTGPGPSAIAPLPGGNGVVQPPSNIDPGITQTPPPAAAFPTPIVRPPATTNNGRTVIVPK